MSFAASAALQAAIYRRLSEDAEVAAQSGGHVYDALPPGKVPPLYVSLGEERVRDASDATGPGARHDFIVSVVTNTAGFAEAKRLAGAVTDALADAELVLTHGHLVSLTFRRARAARTSSGDRRRIDLTFTARTSG